MLPSRILIAHTYGIPNARLAASLKILRAVAPCYCLPDAVRLQALTRIAWNSNDRRAVRTGEPDCLSAEISRISSPAGVRILKRHITEAKLPEQLWQLAREARLFRRIGAERYAGEVLPQ